MASKPFRRQSATKKKVTSDDLPNRHIRFDYSDTYLDNDGLDLVLEDQEHQLRRQQYRKTVENEENYKIAKQNADEMLQLKNALKNRDPNESSKRLSKSAELSRRTTTGELQNSTSDDSTIAKSARRVNVNENEISDHTDGIEVSNKESDPQPKTQINNLTMFLLSLQKLKGTGLRQKLEQSEKHEDKKDSKEEQVMTIKHSRQETHGNYSRPGSYRPSTIQRASGDKRRKSDPTSSRASSQYGIHVKRDFTRSRRELEEISRIEQDAKYGYVNKYEERRKRLLDSCKNTEPLARRINIFLKDVDEFKQTSSNVNTLDKILLRSKSAQLSRTQSTFW